jgi:hypothetical protein
LPGLPPLLNLWSHIKTYTCLRCWGITTLQTKCTRNDSAWLQTLVPSIFIPYRYSILISIGICP